MKQRGGGDGFFAVFESPADAIDCAVAIQRALRRPARRDGFAPEIRIGVHEADALLSGNDYAGLGVHEAARIAAHAEARLHPHERGDGDKRGEYVRSRRARDVAFKGLSDRVAVQDIAWSDASGGSAT